MLFGGISISLCLYGLSPYPYRTTTSNEQAGMQSKRPQQRLISKKGTSSSSKRRKAFPLQTLLANHVLHVWHRSSSTFNMMLRAPSPINHLIRKPNFSSAIIFSFQDKKYTSRQRVSLFPNELIHMIQTKMGDQPVAHLSSHIYQVREHRTSQISPGNHPPGHLECTTGR